MTSHPVVPLARVISWEDRTAWPMFAGATLFVGLSTWLLVDTAVATLHQGIVSLAIVLLWSWFIADYFIRLARAGSDRRLFVRTRAFDLASLVLPLLRPFLIAIYVWRLPVFRYGDGRLQRLRYIVTMGLLSLMFVYTTSWGVLLVERDVPGATIVNFGDALWWGFSTITTVGYGDYTPITALGRVLGVALMIGGIAVIGVTSATIVSGLTERIRGAAHLKRTDGQPLEEERN